MTEHPTSWRVTTLGAVADYWNGRAFKKSEWREPGRGRPIIRIQDLTGSRETPNYFDGDVDDRHIARSGDILVSWAATLGVFVWNGPDAVINQHIFKVEPLIDRRFLRYLLEAVLDDLRRRSHGTGMVHVTRKAFDDTPVALPPDAEQQRIVDVIEEQFSRLDEAEKGLRVARLRADSYLAAMLARLGQMAATVPLGDIALDMRYGTSIKCSYEGVGWPVLRIPNVQQGRVTTDDLKRAVNADADLTQYLLRRGDLLIVRTNGSRNLIGRVAAVHTDKQLAFASYLIRVRLDTDRVDPSFAALALSSPQSREEIESKAATTAGQYNLNLKSIASFSIPLPLIHEQRQLVSEVKEQMTTLGSLSTAVERSLVRSQQLRHSILRRAFSGRLVSRDPSDEPASELLEQTALVGVKTNRLPTEERA